MTFRTRAACIAALCALSATVLVAQGKSDKGPSKWPGTVSFRCTLAGCGPSLPAGAPVDAILGDGTNYMLVQNPLNLSQTAGAGMYNSGGDMHINLGSPTVYAVFLDFTRPFDDHNGCSSYPVSPQECFPYPNNPQLRIDTKTEIQARLTNDQGVDLGIGFEEMPRGTSAKARLRFDFHLLDSAGVDQFWRVRFNKLDYSGASDVRVERLDTEPCTWTLTAGEEEYAGVWTTKNIGKGKAVRLDFGLYSMPFEMTLKLFSTEQFTLPGCPKQDWPS